MQEGYIKFRCDLKRREIKEPNGFSGLNSLRKRLYRLGLIGLLKNGIGFGNVSMRLGGNNEFIITGSATGGKENLTLDDYSIVAEAKIEDNYIRCIGKVKASSESLTHYAAYKAREDIVFVAHIHSVSMWESALGSPMPRTSLDAECGTVLLAKEIFELFRNKDVSCVVMQGHKDGLLFVGRDSDGVYNAIKDML